MEKIIFRAGKEKSFYEFMSNLNEENRIALISHKDLDGIAAARISNEIVRADKIEFADYKDLGEEMIQRLNKDKIKILILTDLSISRDFLKEAEKYFNILIIDHHFFSEDLNSEKTIFLNAEGYCAAYLCYYLFSKIQNIERYDWLVACASIADWCYDKNKNFMKKVFEKYGDKFKINSKTNFIEEKGFLYELHWIITLSIIRKNSPKHIFEAVESIEKANLLKKHALIVQKEIDVCLKKFEKEKIEIKDGYFWELKSKYNFDYLISSQISKKYWHKTIIIGSQGKNFYHLSLRRQDGTKNMAALAKYLVDGIENSSGGGHIPAAGCNFELKYKRKVLEKIRSMK